MTLAVKLLWVVSRDTPAKGEHATAAPAHVVVAAEPLPRFIRKYSAEMDHAPFNPISAPAPAAHPVELKFLPAPKDASGAVVPAGI